MKPLIQTKLISGGNPAAAVAAGAAVITGTAAIIQSFETFNNLGEKIGEATFNYFNQEDVLGKMVYYKDDYKHPNWYVPASQHPNNGGNVHGHFGNF